jgi:hypothetical protein
MSRQPLERLRSVLRVLACGALAFVLTAEAIAGEVLKLRNGDLVPGTVESVDDDTVTFLPEKGGRMQVPWDRVYPINRYELWKSTLAADDASGRVALARWALDNDLFLYARREIAEARGLGHPDSKALDELLADVHRTEADDALADVDSLVAEGSFQDALQRISRYVRDAEDEEQIRRVRSRVADLVQRIERQEELDKEAAEQEKKDKANKKRDEWIKKNVTEANARKAAGQGLAVEGFTYLSKGNQTRARDAMAKAEDAYQDARTIFRRVLKVVGTGETADVCKRELTDCDRRTVQVLQRWGGLEVENKSWKRASAVVDRGLKIDPVDRELLDLRKQIDENWIRRRLSGITNASGRSSGN